MDKRKSTARSDTSGTFAKHRLLALLLAAAGLAMMWDWRDVPFDWYDAYRGNRPLLAARSWHYQLDGPDAINGMNVASLAGVQSDVLVTDFARAKGKIPFTPDEVARLKINPDGRRRLVLSYMSVGEAEQYRFYFDPAWKSAPPPWLGPENCSWPQAHKIRFWMDEWKDISFRAPQSYLRRIIEAGFDGVYLDRVDIFEQWRRERSSSRADMISFVVELAETARRLKPGFFVVPQNADELLADRRYRKAIDGLGREDLLYGASATGQRNRDIDIAHGEARLALLRWSWKPVFAVEYLQAPRTIDRARQELRGLGYVPTIQPRALDGTDPTRPVVALDKDTGTAEYTASRCNKDNSW